MPPAAVKTVRDLIFYQYAKLIAREAGFGDNYAFIMNRFNALKRGQISWSNLTREYRKTIDRGKSCVYCNSAKEIHFDHIIPLSKGGPDTADNMVPVCSSCNSSKGDKDLYDWWVHYKGKDKDSLPRVVAGRYLKLMYDIHSEFGTLDSTDLDGDGKMTVFDLGCFKDIRGKGRQIE
ncbi:MAG: HNH endonuclease [Conexivisphaerales archaeon]